MAYIVVQHQIKDQETFYGLTDEVVGNVPPGVQVRQFCPSEDKSQAVCLWEAPSLEALRSYCDTMAGPEVVENTYYVVNEEYAFGLPQEAAASA
jgi:hypothetical protein